MQRCSTAGRTRVDDAFAGLLAREHALLEGLDAGQRAQLSGLLQRLVAPFDAQA